MYSRLDDELGQAGTPEKDKDADVDEEVLQSTPQTAPHTQRIKLTM